MFVVQLWLGERFEKEQTDQNQDQDQDQDRELLRYIHFNSLTEEIAEHVSIWPTLTQAGLELLIKPK